MITQGRGHWTCPAALAYNIIHDHEMAGITDVHMRSKGLVPSSTENGSARGRGADGEGGR